MLCAACRLLRELAGVLQHEYISQLCSDQALQLLAAPSKSGAIFFLSKDEKFMVKSVTRAESRLLLGILQQYTQHMARHPHSLLTRFFGLHRVDSPHKGGKKVSSCSQVNNRMHTGVSTQAAIPRQAGVSSKWLHPVFLCRQLHGGMLFPTWRFLCQLINASRHCLAELQASRGVAGRVCVFQAPFDAYTMPCPLRRCPLAAAVAGALCGDAKHLL